MRLIECYIENFGKLNSFSLSFKDGVNTILKENGYGKTTLTVFIKAMLFGLDDTKKTKLESNERRHYTPWNEGRFGGSLTIEANGKRYRIERTFRKRASEDEFTLYNLETGKVSYDYTERIGEELFSIDADGFERTVFLSEANLSGKNENKSVSAKLSTLVGYEGDLSSMDEALDILEKSRKALHKRGGSGEIGEIKEKIAECEREIKDILRLRETYEAEEEKLSKTESMLEDSYKKLNTVRQNAKTLEKLRMRRSYEEQYLKMQGAIKKDCEAMTELQEFFKAGVPEITAVESMREIQAEAKRLLSYEMSEEGSEFAALSSVYDNQFSDGDYTKAKEAVARKGRLEEELQRKRDEARAYDGQSDRKMPSLAELDEKISHASLLHGFKVKKNYSVYFVLGALVSLASIPLGILVSPILFLILALGAVLISLGSVNLSKYKKSCDEARKIQETCLWLEEFGVTAPKSRGGVLEALYRLKNDTVSKEKEVERLSTVYSRIEAIESELSSIERELSLFVKNFPTESGASLTDSVFDILEKRAIYLALKEANSISFKKREENIRLANEYTERVKNFLEKYPTKEERPLEEINRKLLEYNTIVHSVEKLRETAQLFAAEHGITEPSDFSDEEALLLDTDELSINEKISILEKEKHLSERELMVLSERIELLSEIEAERDALIEKEKLYEKKLSTILTTKKLLLEAKDSLSAKYLQKTKSAFDKYVKLIANELGGNFQMDTSFTLLKNESGSYKQTEAYSRGTRDTFNLAVRLALIDSLYENETPFIILDDPFAYFDDKKFAEGKDVIKAIAKEKQVLYLTCAEARKI